MPDSDESGGAGGLAAGVLARQENPTGDQIAGATNRMIDIQLSQIIACMRFTKQSQLQAESV